MTLYEERLAQDLEIIKEAVKDIANRVTSALDQAVRALSENDKDALYDVVMNDLAINHDIRDIDKKCHEFVARHLPAAGHLRFISSVLRMTIALERAGDYAVTISRVILQLSKPLPDVIVDTLRSMAELSRRMLIDATQAFLEGDVKLAEHTRKQDYRVDQAYDQIFTAIIDDQTARKPIELATMLKVFAKVERFSDQAKNICEEAIFVATGQMKGPKVFRILFLDKQNDLVSKLAAGIAYKMFPKSGFYSSAGWAPAETAHPELENIASRFGIEIKSLHPSLVNIDELMAFPISYHIIVAINLIDESMLPEIPYHTILRKWEIPTSDVTESKELACNAEELVHELTSLIRNLIERLRGKYAD